MSLDPVTAALDLGGKLIERLFPDKAKRDLAKIALLDMQQSGDLQVITAQAGVITAEAQGDSWLQRSWRPLIMLMFGVIIGNNYLIVPLFGTPSAEIPPDMWDLLKLGLTGYIVGRSAEKGIKEWRGH